MAQSDNETLYSLSEFIISTAVIVAGCYTIHHSIKHILKRWDNEVDYPSGMTWYHHPFGEPLNAGCHISASGIFSILTGISCTKLEPLGYDHKRFDFDSLEDKTVQYMAFSWNDNQSIGMTNNLFHALVYYDGHLFQSYRTQRNWYSPFVDAYPLIRMKLNEKDTSIFENFAGITAIDFNRLCAPSTNPIPTDANVRCITLHRARVNPTRREITLTRILQKA